jgi:cytochrome c oxidase subunit 5b
MFSAVLRAASRPARASVAAAARPVAARRALSVTAGLRSDHAAPSIFGPGGKTGEVPSDEEQATGLARLQLLGDLNDTPVFDYAPLDASRVGTLEDPIKVYSLVRPRPRVTARPS